MIINFEEYIIKKYTDNFLMYYLAGDKIGAGRYSDTFPPKYKDKITIRIREELNGEEEK